MKKTVGLSVDQEIYDKFREICKRKGLVMGSQIEKFIINFLKKEKNL